MKLHVSECSLRFLLPRNIVDVEQATALKNAFQTWNGVWSDTIKEFGAGQALFSDAFTRQDEILSLFHGSTCMGMLLLRWVDFSKFDFRTDSYFKSWDKESVDRLLLNGPRILISSYLTVHPAYRSRETGVHFRDIILDLMVLRFLDSEGDTIAGITRREKKVHTTCYSLGADMIREDIPYFSPADRVDLLGFPRVKAHVLKDENIRNWSDPLYHAYKAAQGRHLRVA